MPRRRWRIAQGSSVIHEGLRLKAPPLVAGQFTEGLSLRQGDTPSRGVFIQGAETPLLLGLRVQASSKEGAQFLRSTPA